jgi:hypothetical protein
MRQDVLWLLQAVVYMLTIIKLGQELYHMHSTLMG